MFHEGSLQSGIALAIQQQKLVACFVQDQSATSTEWEENWLKSGWLSSLLDQKAILLRLQDGSTEAGFLSAFCDVQDPPTFVVIQNGKLQLQLKKGVEKNEFINSVRRVLGAEPIPGSRTAEINALQATEMESATLATTSDSSGDAQPVPQPIPTPPAPAPPSVPSSNAKGKQKAAPPGPKPAPSSVNAAQQAARDALRKKKREEAEELTRIKARIEADKAARRADAETRRAEREAARSSTASTSSPLPNTSTASRTSQSQTSRSPTVNLQIRLFDGRTIRSTFLRTATLEADVRPWIDAEFAKLPSTDPNIAGHKQLPPYFFRHILPPQPSRELSAADEAQELCEIELIPSATLVLVPVKGYTEAYGAGGGNGIVGAATGLVGGAFGLVSSTVGLVGGALGVIVGMGGTPSGTTETASTSASEHKEVGVSSPSEELEREKKHRSVPMEAGSIRIRTLADQRAGERETQQFYNGNQLDFEPRTDDGDR